MSKWLIISLSMTTVIIWTLIFSMLLFHSSTSASLAEHKGFVTSLSEKQPLKFKVIETKANVSNDLISKRLPEKLLSKSDGTISIDEIFEALNIEYSIKE